MSVFLPDDETTQATIKDTPLASRVGTATNNSVATVDPTPSEGTVKSATPQIGGKAWLARLHGRECFNPDATLNTATCDHGPDAKVKVFTSPGFRTLADPLGGFMMFVPNESLALSEDQISAVEGAEYEKEDKTQIGLVVGRDTVVVRRPLETWDGSPPEQTCKPNEKPQVVQWSQHQYSVSSRGSRV